MISYLLRFSVVLLYRLVIDDGSGEAHVYAEEDLLRQLLQVSMAEWNSVCDLVRRVGTVSYTKSFSATQHVCLSIFVWMVCWYHFCFYDCCLCESCLIDWLFAVPFYRQEAQVAMIHPLWHKLRRSYQPWQPVRLFNSQSSFMLSRLWVRGS